MSEKLQQSFMESIKDLEKYAVKAIMPPGWVNYDKK